MRKSSFVMAALAAMVVGSAQATPINVPMFCITPGLPAQCALALSGSQVTADVSGSLLTVTVGYTGADGVIASFFTDDHTGQLSFANLTNGAGMSFTAGAPLAPPDLPGGNVFGFTADTALSADANNPKPTNGISIGDGVLTIDYSFTGVLDNNIVLEDLANGSLEFGLHVISLACGDVAGCGDTVSVSLESEGQEGGGGGNDIPEPTPLAIMGAGLIGASIFGKRKKYLF